jgi:hypothetical protein
VASGQGGKRQPVAMRFCYVRSYETSASMSILRILVAILAAAAIVAVPVAMIWSMVVHFRTPPSQRRRGGASSNAVGAALQELDRLMARPSIEHTVETQKELPRRDDQDDE